MWTRVTLLATALALLVAAPAAAQLQGPFGPWDGATPFNCQIQDVGMGTTFPDPDADPFCVEFDKTQQNVTDLGIVDFLLNEPARVAAAVPKCFYYQSDHWTGSIVQGQDPELWHWDGQYFFDKAIGAGGVNLQNLRILGQPATLPPGILPPEFEPYFDQGGGGAYVVANIPADPTCAARVDTPEERAEIYANGTPPPSPPVTGGSQPSGDALTPAAATAGAIAKPKDKKKCRRQKCKRHRRR